MYLFSDLIAEIVEALSQESAMALSSVCVNLGLAGGSSSEAMCSKRTYLRARINGLLPEKLLELAAAVLTAYPTEGLRRTYELALSHEKNQITDLTRNKILDELIMRGSPLEGNLNLIDFLKRTFHLEEMVSTDSRFSTAEGDIRQHMVNNYDWDEDYLYKNYLGLLQASDSTFLRFIEQLVHPRVRTLDEQEAIVELINRHLVTDGYSLEHTDNISGYKVFTAQPTSKKTMPPVKNIIFAADGPKPELVLSDALVNDISIIKHAERCLVYDRPISASGLTWTDLVRWWSEQVSSSQMSDSRDYGRELYSRLVRSLDSAPERILFRTYFQYYSDYLENGLPALIPQVYLHYDPYTIRQLRQQSSNGEVRLERQRMDFLMLMPRHGRVVLEIDGKHHYSVGEIASPERYAAMVREDRALHLRGYDVFRFGGSEFTYGNIGNTLKDFFDRLLNMYGVRPGC